MASPKLSRGGTAVGDFDRIDAARRLFEAGAPVFAVAAATGLTEAVIIRQSKTDAWSVPDAVKRVYADVVDRSVTVRAEEARASSALSISEEEAAELIKVLGSRDVTLPERANQYTAIMARVSMRVAVLYLSMTDEDLLKHADNLAKLDSVARRTLHLGGAAPPNPTLGQRTAHTTVNVMATSNALPPLLSGEAAVNIVQEKVLFQAGGLPPIRGAAVQKIKAPSQG